MKRNTLLKWCLVVLAALTVLGSVTLIGFAQESTEQNAPSPTLDIKTFNLSLENAVFMNFKVANENVSDPASIQLLAWDEAPAEYKKGTEDLCLSANNVDANTGYAVFQYTDLAAKDMTKMVYVCAYVNEDGVEAYSEPAKFSIAMYAYLKKYATNPDTELCTLLDSMLAYGAAAQTYFNHNTDLLATDTIYQIKVTGGTLPDGFFLGWYKENTTVTLTANAPEEGYVFSHWTNSAGESVSTEATITVDVTKAETYTANYKETVTYSTGLRFTSNGDGTCYVSGIGTCSDTDIKIPPVSPDGWKVTSIGFEAFRWGGSSLTDITIPNSVTSIGNSAFSGCTNLTNITIGSGLTSIDYHAFHNCSGLATITVDPENQAYHSNGNCLIETASKTLIVGCMNSVIPSDGSVTSIGEAAFYGCKSLTKIIIPNEITCINDRAFQGCNKLTNVFIPNNVTLIGGYAFYDCSKLSSINIPVGIKEIYGYTFYHCTSLSSITIPRGVTAIGTSAFSGCTNLTTIAIPDTVISIGWDTFSGCKGLTSITIPNSVTSIGNNAFRDCSNLTGINIPEKVVSIGHGAFFSCSNLESITVDTGNKIYHSSGNCLIETESKKLLTGCMNSTIPVDGSVTIIYEDAFYLCRKLTNITIPYGITEICSDAFYGCNGLTNIILPDSLIKIGQSAFGGCNSLTSITIPFVGSTKDEMQVTKFGHLFVSGQSSFVPASLKTVIITCGKHIGKQAFSGCINITNIVLPDSVTNIGDSAFNGCHSLTNITIPDSVTSIGEDAFYNCTSLTSITIPDSVTSIGSYAFSGCSNLTSISFQGTMAQWNAIPKEYAWKSNVPATVVVCSDGNIVLK